MIKALDKTTVAEIFSINSDKIYRISKCQRLSDESNISNKKCGRKSMYD